LTRGKTHIPVSFQLIDTVRKGYCLLDKSTQAEVAGFIESMQHETGLFTSRDNSPDLYYSLFGTWMVEALELSHTRMKIKNFFMRNELNSDYRSSIDSFASILIQSLLIGENYKKPGYLSLFNFLSGKGMHVDFAYRAFFFLLSYDALYKPGMVFQFLARVPLYLYALPADSPSSFQSAVIIAKHSAGMKVDKEADALMSYFEEEKGFKVYCHQKNADMLSTAVSLFALKKAGSDLRMIAPACVQLIQENYRSGAFVAGDGDETRDLEYTFYGLLALGALK